MSVSLVVAGTSYTYPSVGDTAWGAQATAWAQAVSVSMLQTSGGTFFLTSEVDFGSSFGLKSIYFKSRTANPASAGAIRLANLDSVKWRNAANNADIGIQIDASNIFQFGGAITSSGAISGTNISGTTSGTNTGDVTLAAFGSTPNANGLSLSGQALNMQPADGTHPGGVSIAAQTFAGAKTFSNALLISDGLLATPGLAFSSETGTGWLRTGAANPTFAVTGTAAIDVNKLSSTQINFGFGGAAGGSTGSALSANYTYNGIASFNYSNLSQGSAAVTQFYIGSGAGGGNGITVENQAFASTAYTGGGGLLSAGPNLSFLNICAENASGYMTFNVGGRTLATEGMRLGLSGTGLTLNKGWGKLVLSGASSGAITLAAPATGTYSLTLPLLQGGSGTILTNSDGAGTLTWTSPLANPMTTGGDIIYGGSSGTPTRLANGSAGQTLTSNGSTLAPTWTTTNPMTTGGDIIYGGSSGALTRLANGSSGNYLKSAGGTSAPTWAAFTAPTTQLFATNGTQTGWLFTVSTWAGTIAVGDTYTNNSNTYTVQGAQTNGTGQTLFMSGTGATSGTTLTKAVSASGPATITFSAKVATATYTTPANALYLRVKIVGGGGGGAGSGTGAGTAATDGTGSFFGANLLVANGGAHGIINSATGGAGGTATGRAADILITGGAGGSTGAGIINSAAGGGMGGASAFGGAGASGGSTAAGSAGSASANSGAGGGGGGSQSASVFGGTGGGAGGYVEAIITSPAATYPYVVGASGTAGAAGTSGNAGGAGAAGLISVFEGYQ